MTAHLDGDSLTKAVVHLVNNYSPHRVGYTELSSSLREFLLPLTHEGLKDSHIKTLLELAEDHREMDDEAASPFAAMEGKTGSYRRHSAKALQKVRVAAMAICEGGTP